MTKMKAAVVHTFGQPLTIEEVDVPAVPAGQVLVKVVASGVCHTDLHAADGDWVAISGIGGLGHYAVQYAKAMGFHVIAVDIDDAKLSLATKVGADMVLNAKTVRGSIVGTRKDLQESLEFAAEGKVYGTYTEDRLDNINAILGRLKAGQIEGRVVLRIAGDQ